LDQVLFHEETGLAHRLKAFGDILSRVTVLKKELKLKFAERHDFALAQDWSGNMIAQGQGGNFNPNIDVLIFRGGAKRHRHGGTRPNHNTSSNNNNNNTKKLQHIKNVVTQMVLSPGQKRKGLPYGDHHHSEPQPSASANKYSHLSSGLLQLQHDHPHPQQYPHGRLFRISDEWCCQTLSPGKSCPN